MTTANVPQSVGSELLEVNFALLVGGMGQGIADAQLRLDMVSMQLAQMMSGRDYKLLVMDENGNFRLDENQRPLTIDMPAVRINFGGGEYSLLELGFTPTFYQFVDTIIEVKVSVSITRETTAIIEFDRRRFQSESGRQLDYRVHGGSEGLHRQRRVCVQVSVQRRRIEPAAHQTRARATTRHPPGAHAAPR